LFWDATQHSYSYPSGHAFNSAMIYLMVALLLGRHLNPRTRRGLLIAAIVLTLVIGLTRIYLGVHWPTDVIGGWLGGVGGALLVLWLDRRLKSPKS
jgi:undecaprenyl-diphosphatase